MNDAPTGREYADRDLLFAGPAHVDLDLTNACNLACSHCDVSSGKPLKSELDTSQMIKLVEDLHGLGTMSLTIAGGEPFLRRDAIDIIERACTLPGWAVTVITNGTYFTPNLVDALLTRCPGLTINVSVDGSTPERFDFLRHRRRRTPEAQEKLFREVTDGMRFAIESGLKVHANFALTRSNRNDLEATYDLVMDLGARDLLAIKFFAGGRGLDYLTTMEFPYNEWAATLVDLTRSKMAGSLPKLALALPSAWEFYLPLRDAGMNLEQAEKTWRYRAPLREPYYARSGSIGDPSGIADLNVVANGDVYPITLMSGNYKAHAGSVKTAQLDDIWQESTRLWHLREMRLKDLPHECNSCEIKDLCGGGSRARALVHTGSLNGGDLTCPKLGDSGGLLD